MKLWDKGTGTEELIHNFTVGNDTILDKRLAKYDVIGSIAHAKMLHKVGLLKEDEVNNLIQELELIKLETEKGSFTIPSSFEDIHSYVEYLLTEKLGETGKKIHTGRSRNDQVLVDLHLYLKEELVFIKTQIKKIAHTFLNLAEKNKNKLLPGYTHTQIAMPSSFGLWFSAYAELLADDLFFVEAAYKVADQNPLGSAAGFGSSFPLDRKETTQLLGFSTLKYNSVAAQMSRGKLEKSTAYALSAVASTLSKFSVDVVAYMCQNFGFITFPDELTTGSSIMPHKKNPDVFELVRAKCNSIQSLPSEIGYITNNLISGYHRDFQLLKETLFKGIDELKNCLVITNYMLQNIIVNSNLLDNEKYKYLFTVESVGKLVQEGKSFRDAYKEVGVSVENNTYKTPEKVNYTHEGSIDNLCLKEIKDKLEIFNI